MMNINRLKNRKIMFILSVLVILIVLIIVSYVLNLSLKLYTRAELEEFQHITISKEKLYSFMKQKEYYLHEISSEIQFHVDIEYKSDCDSYTNFESYSGSIRLERTSEHGKGWWHRLCLYNEDFRICFDMDNYESKYYKQKNRFKEEVNNFLKEVMV